METDHLPARRRAGLTSCVGGCRACCRCCCRTGCRWRTCSQSNIVTTFNYDVRIIHDTARGMCDTRRIMGKSARQQRTSFQVVKCSLDMSAVRTGLRHSLQSYIHDNSVNQAYLIPTDSIRLSILA